MLRKSYPLLTIIVLAVMTFAPCTIAQAQQKVEVGRSQIGNMVTLASFTVTADEDACIPITPVLDKKEEDPVRVAVKIKQDGRQIATFPVTIPEGVLSGTGKICASMGGVASAIKPGQTYTLEIFRALVSSY